MNTKYQEHDTQTIQQHIQEKLSRIEETEQVKILHAVESGSRAWGFASPDSDYDVRFIYVRKQSAYLRLNPVRDVIESELNEIYDVNGWDLKKALCLAKKSNPTVFEWMHSPIVYRTTDFWQTCIPVLEQYFSCKAGAYHYLHTAKANYFRFLTDDTVKLKKYFYALRPVLACRWILQYRKPAPMLFSTLADAVLEQEMQPIVQALLDKKTNLTEAGLSPGIPELNAYLLQSMDDLRQQTDSLPYDKNPDWEALNQVFLNGINIAETQRNTAQNTFQE